MQTNTFLNKTPKEGIFSEEEKAKEWSQVIMEISCSWFVWGWNPDLRRQEKNARLPAEQTQYNAPIKGCSFISTRDVCPIQYAICLLSTLNDKANYPNLISFSIPQTDSKSSPHDWQRIVCVWAFCVLPQSWLLSLCYIYNYLFPTNTLTLFIRMVFYLTHSLHSL